MNFRTGNTPKAITRSILKLTQGKIFNRTDAENVHQHALGMGERQDRL
jgi:hypothetical protein